MKGELFDIQDGLEQALTAVQKYGYIEKGEGRTDFLIRDIFYGNKKRFKVTPEITQMAKDAIQYHRWYFGASNFIYRAFQVTERRVFDRTRCGVIAKMAGTYYFEKHKPHYEEAEYVGKIGERVEFYAPIMKRGQFVDQPYETIKRVYIMRTVNAIFVWRTPAVVDNIEMAFIRATVKAHYEHKGEKHTVIKDLDFASLKSEKYKRMLAEGDKHE